MINTASSYDIALLALARKRGLGEGIVSRGPSSRDSRDSRVSRDVQEPESVEKKHNPAIF